MCIYIYICWLRCLRCIFCIFADWIAECIADFLIFAALVRCFFFAMLHLSDVTQRLKDFALSCAGSSKKGCARTGSPKSHD